MPNNEARTEYTVHTSTANWIDYYDFVMLISNVTENLTALNGSHFRAASKGDAESLRIFDRPYIHTETHSKPIPS